MTTTHITMKGETITVLGKRPEVGQKAPDFTLNDLDNNPVSLSDYKGKRVLISVFPDINTRICDLQTVRFFQESKDLENTVILNVSNNSKTDLENWCATKGVDAVMLHDDEKVFANTYGLWIEELNKLARSIFVIDVDGTLLYSELVSETAQEPNYDKALSYLK